MRYSVLMTVYKTDNPLYLAQSLDSMINQTISPDEIVLVKDGPIPDEIQKIIDARCSYGIPVLQIQLPYNVGLGLALNEGIKACRNELIARMDADDISFPQRCEMELKAFAEDPELDIIGCPVLEFVGDVVNIVGSRKVPESHEEIYKFCRRRDPFNHPSVMYKKSVLQKVGCYHDLRKNQDTDLWIRLLKSGARAKNLSTSFLYFRFDNNTYKKRRNWENTKLLIKIRYDAWRNSFCSFFDLIVVFTAQIGIFIMPAVFQKFIYKVFLRK